MILDKIKVLILLVLSIFLLTGCFERRTVDIDMIEQHSEFLQYSLGDFEIRRPRRATRTTIVDNSGILPSFSIVRIRGTEWTLTYNDYTGQQRRLTIDNLTAPRQGTTTRLQSAVLNHAEITLNERLNEILREHFTNREIRRYSLSIEFEREGAFRFGDAGLLDEETRISLVNLSTQNLTPFANYNFRFSGDVTAEDFATKPELRPRFEGLANDLLMFLEDERIILHFGDLTSLDYNFYNNEFVWRIHGILDENAFTECGNLSAIRVIYLRTHRMGVEGINSYARFNEEIGEHELFLVHLLLGRVKERYRVRGDVGHYWEWSIGDKSYKLVFGSNYLEIDNGVYITEVCVRPGSGMPISMFEEITGARIRIDEIARTLHIDGRLRRFQWPITSL